MHSKMQTHFQPRIKANKNQETKKSNVKSLVQEMAPNRGDKSIPPVGATINCANSKSSSNTILSPTPFTIPLSPSSNSFSSSLSSSSSSSISPSSNPNLSINAAVLTPSDVLLLLILRISNSPLSRLARRAVRNFGRRRPLEDGEVSKFPK